MITWAVVICLITGCGAFGGNTNNSTPSGGDPTEAAESAGSGEETDSTAAAATGERAEEAESVTAEEKGRADSGEAASRTAVSGEGFVLADQTLAGWHIVVDQTLTGASMKNVSVDLGYTSLETSEFVKEASEGCIFCAVKLTIEKNGGTELIEWEKMILSDSEGNQYHRIDDEFIADLGMKHMSGGDLNFGTNEGWIVYEIPEEAEGLTLSYAFEEETFTCSLDAAGEAGVTAAADAESASRTKTAEAGGDHEAGSLLTETDIFARQKSTDEALQAELQKAGDFMDPTVIVDPYEASPLTAVVIFRTEKETGGSITVKGKEAVNDITGTFAPASEHIVPVYGLYNGETTQVELKLDDGQTNTLEITAEKQNLEFGEFKAQMIDEKSYDYSKLIFIYPFGGTIYAVDSAGDIRWCYSGGGSMGVHPLKNGHLMVPSAPVLKATYYKEGLQEIDFCGKIYKQDAVPGGQHHDFQELPNGNLLVAGDAPDLSSIEDHVLEIDRETGEVVWSLDMKNLLPRATGQSASMDTDGSEELDWCHNNSIWYDEKTDRVLLSARHLDAIIAVNKSDQTLAWILGDPAGWENVDPDLFFTPEGDDFEWQYAQHQVTMLDNGDIMLFDNGTAKVKRIDGGNRVSGKDVYSRAVVYRIDTENMTVRQIYQYGKERGADWYADWVSGVESQDGTADNLWITAGSHLYSPEEERSDYYPRDMMTPGLVKSTIIDQVVDGKLIYELVISGDTYLSLSFRSSRISLYGEDCAQNIEALPEYLGGLGVTEPERTEPAETPVRTLEAQEWSFVLDAVKLTVNGTYSSAKKADEIAADYLVLSDGKESRYYPVTQYKTESEDGNAASVSVSGWLSRGALEGSCSIWMMLDGVLYDSGYTVGSSPAADAAAADAGQAGTKGKSEEQLAREAEHKTEEPVGEPAEMQKGQQIGYYGKIVDAVLDPDDLVLISENDASSAELQTDITVEESMAAGSLRTDQMVQAELDSGNYTFEEPLVINDPYQNAPLSGLILFTTEEECGIRVTVKGKTEAADVAGELQPARQHRVPVIGLYPGTENTVTLEKLGEDGSVTESKTLKIQTDALPDALKDVVQVKKASGDSAYNLTVVYGQMSNIPFAYDCNGDVRWYINRKVGASGLYMLSNGRMIMQDNTGYTPNLAKPHTTNLYELDCLGRYYRMYYLANGCHHEVIEKEPGGNLLTLSNSLENHFEDEIVELDRETGRIVNELELIDIFGDTYTNLIDWAHINTVSWQKEEDTILISCRNLHSVMKIGWTDHELKWILGNPEFWKGTPFEEYVLEPQGDFLWQYQQHSAYQLSADLDGDPGTVEISLFDNHSDGYRKVPFYDQEEGSYLMVFSVDEKAGTVSCLKRLEVIRSVITSNTIYDEASGHIFGMCGYVAAEDNEGRCGMVYEFDYETGEILNQYSVLRRFYRASPLALNYDDMAAEMDVEENYIKGTLKKAVKTQETVEVPEKTLTEEEVSVKLIGRTLYVQALDHTVSQVIFRGSSGTYVYDEASIPQYEKGFEEMSVSVPIPLAGLEADTYQIICVYKDQPGLAGGSFTVR